MTQRYRTVRHECFNGSETGAVDVTLLRQWLESTKARPELCSFTKDNLKGMLDAHEWDASFKGRVANLRKHRGKWKPMITVKADVGCYVIDGWHRLYILYRQNLSALIHTIPFQTYMIGMDALDMFRPKGVHIVRDFKPGEIIE